VFTPLSGSLSGQKIELFSGNVFVPLSGSLSGQKVELFSGNIFSPLSGSLSGQVVTAASGVFGTASLNSGQQVRVYSGNLSGQKVELFSGNVTSPLSGAFVQAALNSGTVTTNTFESGLLNTEIPHGGRGGTVSVKCYSKIAEFLGYC